MKLDNGYSVFVKVATDDDTARWIRDEAKVYAVVQGDFMPAFLGWDDGEFPILILEDLSEATWAWEWSPELLQRVINMLGMVTETTVPDDFPPLTRMARALKGWQKVAADPTGFLRLGLVSADWLASALPSLIAAEGQAKLDGESLVHLDTRSDNICFYGDRTLLIDWNWASKGNPKADVMFWLPSVHAEGGPAPWDITLSEPELIAMVAGYYANQAHKPPHKQGPAVRQLQLRMLESALPWAIKALKLPTN